jgi:hypothetical protein
MAHDKSLDADEARFMQRILMALMTDFSEGLRRQVIAGLRIDKLRFTENLGHLGLITPEEAAQLQAIVRRRSLQQRAESGVFFTTLS